MPLQMVRKYKITCMSTFVRVTFQFTKTDLNMQFTVFLITVTCNSCKHSSSTKKLTKKITEKTNEKISRKKTNEKKSRKKLTKKITEKTNEKNHGKTLTKKITCDL